MRSRRLLTAFIAASTALTVLVTASPAAADPPAAPTSITVTPGVHELTVDWSPSAGADRYVARLSPTQRQITSTTASGVTFDRLVAGVAYTVTVTPIDDDDGFGDVASASGTPLDRPSDPPEIADVVTGGEHSCALFDDGTLRCWGRGAEGQLGYGDDENLGDDEGIRALPAIDVGARVVQVSGGDRHTCVVTEDGTVRCWGSSDEGALGYPGVEQVGVDDVPADVGDVDIGDTAVQVSAGAEHTCALTAGGRVRCWGSGDEGRLGHSATTDVGDDETPASAGNARIGTRALQVGAGDRHSCAITVAGAVRCWGSGDLGQLGYADTDDIGDNERPATAGDLRLGALATSLASGGVHNCVITTSTSVRCWGDNGAAQLLHPNFRRIGNDEHPEVAGDVPISASISEIATGQRHTCVVAPDAGLGCWGRNVEGRLGYGTPPDQQPIFSIGAVPLGDDPVVVGLGNDHTCVLTRVGTVRCFGDGAFGQLGSAATADIGDDELPADLDAIDLLTAPGAPITEVVGGASSLTISYSAPDDDGGAAITTYRVVAQPGDNAVTQTAAGTLTLIGLRSGTEYTVSVTATNAYGTSVAAPATASTDPGTPITPQGSGYWMADSQGALFDFGDAAAFEAVSITPGSTVVDLDATPSGNGLWVLDSAGAVHTRGDASDFGDVNAGVTGRPTTLAPTPTGDGYWIFTSTGDVSTHGSAVDHGDLTDLALNGPIIASAATTSGDGYWLLGTDGGVFALGDAEFFGSMGGIPLNAPVNGITPDPDGQGYWLVASDGGVFAFDAPFRGSVPGELPDDVSLNAPVTGLIPYGSGYAMVATDGGAFVFSDEPFLGSLGGQSLPAPITAMAAVG